MIAAQAGPDPAERGEAEPEERPAPFRRKLYGRRKGKALRASQQRLIDEVLPGLSVPLAAEPAPVLDAPALFGRPVSRLWLEVGFGGGEHLVHQAVENPDAGIVGCEPFVNGVAMLLGRLEGAGPGNVRIHPGDARDLIDRLRDGCLDRVFVLYPDPWPKARHHRRRFMNPGNLALLARVMRPGATLRLATDIPEYVEHALAAIGETGGTFEATGENGADWSVPWADWPGTRYEAKALRAGRRPHYLTFRRA